VAGNSSNVFNVGQEALGLAGTKATSWNFQSRQENILKNYESVTYKFSFGAIDRRSYNTASYLKEEGQDPRWIVIGESGYTGTKQTSERPKSTGDVGSRAPATGVIPEYYINNFKFTTNMPGSGLTVDGNTGMAGGSFEVFEPYSLGLFFESLMSSALLSGYNHFVQAPFLIKIEFHGWTDGKSETVDGATRFIPVNLSNVEFNATESGSNYTVSFMTAETSQSLSEFTTDVGNAITFDVREDPGITLFALGKAMNEREQEKIANKQKTLADEYVILLQNVNYGEYGDAMIKWPEEPKWADFVTDPNKVKNADLTSDKQEEFGPNAVPVVKNKTQKGKFVYSATKDQKLSLLTVINDVMCHTNIGVEALTKADKKSDTYWWTVEKKFEYLSPDGPIDPATGKFPKKFYYIIRPFIKKVDQVTASTAGKELTQADVKNIKKVYSYLYTGQNDEIITYNLNFNAAFFLSGNHTDFSQMRESMGNLIPNEVVFVNPAQGRSDVFNQLVPGAYPTEFDKNSFPSLPGGIGVDATELNVARWLSTKITGHTNDADKDKGTANLYQVRLDLEVLGDPYYIPAGSVGNQSYDNVPSAMWRNSMNWEGSDVKIYVRFKTIQDYPFPGSNLPIQSQQTDHPFSGVYTLLRNISTFNDGVFTQKLMLAKDLNFDPTTLKSSSQLSQDLLADATSSLLGADQKSRSDLGSYDIKTFTKKGAAE
jgi:hypothetical protein